MSKEILEDNLAKNEKWRKIALFLIYFSGFFVVLDVILGQYVWAIVMVGVTLLNMHTLKVRENISASYRDMIRRCERDDTGETQTT